MKINKKKTRSSLFEQKNGRNIEIPKFVAMLES